MKVITKDELKVIAVKKFKINECNYQIVDFLNKSLKDHGFIFGLTQRDESNVLTIYEIDMINEK